MSDPKVSLVSRGTKFGGWKSVSVKKSIKSICGSFSVSYHDVWNSQNKPWRLIPEDPCQVLISGEPVITGFIDTLDLQFDAKSKSISASGRDKTCDLVDCSADIESVEFKKQTPEKIIEALCRPFGIKVINEAGALEPFAQWTIQRSETAYENIAKIAKKRGFLVRTNAAGDLVLLGTKRSRAANSLIEGENILGGGCRYDSTNRFSRYKVQTQAQGSGFFDKEDVDSETVITGIEAVATDSVVKRHRPLIIVSSSPGSDEDAKKRAQWEATVRAAQSAIPKITLYGWRQSNGKLWDINQVTRLSSPWLGIDQDVLISEIEYSYSVDGGELVHLQVESEKAYIPEPVVDEGFGLWGELSEVN